MTSKLIVSAALCGLAVTSVVQAQTAAPMGPPKVMQIYREVVKPGHGAVHANTEAGWPAAFAKANWPAHYIGLTSTSGPTEAWFISGWPSFAAYEKDGDDIEKNAALQAELDRLSAADGEHLSSATSMFATLREDLSYGGAVNIPQMRYFLLTTYRVKPGRTADFVAAGKIILATHEQLKMDEHWALYQVTSGAPGGTYLIIQPIKSMADIDAIQEMHKGFDGAMGEENQKKFRDLTSTSVESSTNVLLHFSPKMSYTPKEWAAADPFWARPAAKPAAKAPPKKVN